MENVKFELLGLLKFESSKFGSKSLIALLAIILLIFFIVN